MRWMPSCARARRSARRRLARVARCSRSMGSIPKPGTTATTTFPWRSTWSTFHPRTFSTISAFTPAFPCCFEPRMHRTAIAFLWLIPLAAHGQGGARANPAIIQEDAPPSAVRARGEGAYPLAERLASEQLWISALNYYAEVLKSGKGSPQYLRAVAALVDLQQRLNDQYLIPNLLALSFDSSWNALPPGAIARVNYWVANVQLRRGNLDRAQTLLSAIPAADPIYPKARYLIGVVLSDPRYPG